MAKGKEHGDQHFVPRCYTAAWCDPDTPQGMQPYVWVFPAGNRTGRRKAPKNIFSETDFYTVHEQDGTRNLTIEKRLSALESDFAIIRERLGRHELLSPDELINLLRFIAAMSARTRAQRDHQRNQWSKAKNLMESMMEQFEKSTPAQRKALLDHPANRPPVESEGGGTYQDVAAMVENPMQFTLNATIEVMLPILARMSLAVIETDNGVGFVTSDNPCVQIDREAHKAPPFFRNNPPLLRKTVELSLPISPRQMIVLSWTQIAGYLQTDQHGVDELNRRTIAWADKEYVTCRNETRDVFEERPLPEDSWENTRARLKAETEQTATKSDE